MVEVEPLDADPELPRLLELAAGGGDEGRLLEVAGGGEEGRAAGGGDAGREVVLLLAGGALWAGRLAWGVRARGGSLWRTGGALVGRCCGAMARVVGVVVTGRSVVATGGRYTGRSAAVACRSVLTFARFCSDDTTSAVGCRGRARLVGGVEAGGGASRVVAGGGVCRGGSDDCAGGLVRVAGGGVAGRAV